MNADVLITCAIRCDSAESLRTATEFAQHRVRPDEEITRTHVTFPGGVERREVRAFRLGDYFDTIELLSGSSGESFTLTFHVNPGAGADWKYLIVSVLRELNESARGVSASVVPTKPKT